MKRVAILGGGPAGAFAAERLAAAGTDMVPVDGWSQTVTSSNRSTQSVTSSDICRTSHGAASRRKIRVSPSPLASTPSAACCSARRRDSSKSSSLGTCDITPGESQSPDALFIFLTSAAAGVP